MAELEEKTPISFLFDEIITCGAVLSGFELCEALRELGHECYIVSPHRNEELERYFKISPIRKPIGNTITFTPRITGDYAYIRTKDGRWNTHRETRIAVSEYISKWCKADCVIGNGTHRRFKNLVTGKDIDILIEGNNEPNKNIPATIEKAKEIAKEREIQDPNIVWFGRNTVPNPYVENISHPPLEDIPILYNRAKIFLAMSKNEGFGRPVAEAMKCGCNVINLNGGNNTIKIQTWQEIAKELVDYLNDRKTDGKQTT